MKQFDDIFREKVDKAFSDYNADHLADEGWNSFLADKKKREPDPYFILPVWGRAASIALVIGLGALIIYLSVNPRSARENVLTATETGRVNETPSTVIPGIAAPPSDVIADMAQPHRENNAMSHAEYFVSQDVTGKPNTNEMDQKAVSMVNADKVTLPVIAENVIPLNNEIIKSGDQNKLNKDSVKKPEQTIFPVTEKHSRSTTFLTGLSGIMAHVNDAAITSPGVSVGVYLEQKISGRISLRPGLAFGMSSLGIDNTQGSPAFTSAISIANGMNGTLESFSGQLRMVTMEVPLNIVFKLFERKSSSVYMSAGASTIFYISEHFTGDFVNKYTLDKINESTGMTYTESRYSTVSVEDTYGAFSRMDYFGLANVSAGYSLPLGKSSILRIEPFMQFPLDDLTSLDLRVYYTGISLKISPGRKKY